MAGICFYFENVDIDVWSGHNLDAWHYACKMAGDIDKMIVINQTDQIITNPDFGTYDFSVVKSIPSLDNAATLIPPWRTVTGKSLWNFDHNVEWYIFGPASGAIEPQGEEIYIPQEGIGALHSVHICSITLAHRYGVKQWR